MTNLMDDVDHRHTGALGQSSQVELTEVEIALIIDALLQAEMTLPLLDRRYMALKPIEILRDQQLSLANRLEDVMARANRRQDGNQFHPAWALHWQSEQP